MATTHHEYRVGLVGLGFIARYHAQAISHLTGVRIVAACDTNRSRAEAFARLHGISQAYDSLETMLQHEELDVIHVLVPPDHHADVAREALEANAHVFLEKPMCVRVSDCEELISQAVRKGVSLGVNHNFLFYLIYERLVRDVRTGILGRLDHITIDWNQELSFIKTGPFDLWMLRDPRNILLEIGSHSVAHMLNLAGTPEDIVVKPTDPIDLPALGRFYRRWHVWAYHGRTAIELRCSFVRGFPERRIHVRGTLGTATADFENNTYVLQRHSRYADDFGRYQQLTATARVLHRQARGNLCRYVSSKLGLSDRGSAFGYSIARSVQAFYAGLGGPPNERHEGQFGRKVVEQCVRMGEQAGIEAPRVAWRPQKQVVSSFKPDVLVLGGTGFIGQELLRQLLGAGRSVRLMTRHSGHVPFDTDSAHLEVVTGSLLDDADTRRAMEGVTSVVHLARARARTWADYYDQDVMATKQVAQCCLEQGIRRLIYTSTIAVYYAGKKAGTINEQTPRISWNKRRDSYSRAKAMSEELLLKMHRDKNLPVVILRPGIVVGRGGSPFHWGVGMWPAAGVCRIWGHGRDRLPLVLVEDVASALIASIDKEGIEGETFNLVGHPCITAREYLTELERYSETKYQVFPTPIWRFYSTDVCKWIAKILVNHPEHRRPSYRDWESRTARAFFDCSKAQRALGWQPHTQKAELIHKGIHVPVDEECA